VAVCPEAVAIDASDTSKIDRLFDDIVVDIIRCVVVGALRRARLISVSLSRIAALARFPNPG
jgi:hypothetical protein